MPRVRLADDFDELPGDTAEGFGARAAAVESLPWHHHDPFDRLLVAQALAEGAAVVSGDANLEPYGVALVW